jgi:hypothetical protein
VQAQLRGLIGDYQGGDEALFSQAIEALDMLNSCLTNPAESAPQPAEAAPQPAAPAPKDEAPLISFE